jgi:hypothetical protein
MLSARTSKNLQATVALNFARYNQVRLHKTLRVTPAMAANVTDRIGYRRQRIGGPDFNKDTTAHRCVLMFTEG